MMDAVHARRLRAAGFALAAVLAFGLASGLATGPASAQTHPPKDDAENLPDFAAYRAGLLVAARRRDVDGVIARSAPDVLLSFGGDQGPDGVRALFTGFADQGVPAETAAATANEAWEALVFVLTHGVHQHDDGSLVAPYWFAADPPATFDPFETFFVVGSDVLLRSGPSPQAPAIDALSYAFVRATGPAEDAGPADAVVYAPVETASGRAGFVAADYLISAVDYRAGFARSDGAWRMTFFLAGD